MPLRRDRRVRRRLRLIAILTPIALIAVAGPAFADNGSIDHVESTGGKLQVLYSVPTSGSGTPDLSTLKVTLGGKQVDAKATLASDAKNAVRRTAVLAVDVSNSMAANNKFAEAKRAAQLFIDSAPSDLYIGIVTFASKVTVAQPPSLDRAASSSVIKNLSLSKNTLLYDGVRQAVTSSGTTGQRNVIVLSDGRDTSSTKLDSVTKAVKQTDVKVDVVALDQSSRDEQLLTPLSAAGGGSVISARDPKALGKVFASEAQDLAKQIQVTGTAPAGVTEGTLEISLDDAGQTYTDSAFVTVSGEAPAPAAGAATTKLVEAPKGFSVPPRLMLGGIAALGLGVLVILIGIFGGFGGARKETLESRIDAYTRKGQQSRPNPQETAPVGVAAQAVDMANRALASNRGFETKLGDRLDAAAVSLKPAEWLLVHASIAMAGAAAVFALTGGSILFGLGGLVAGIILPWTWLGIKRSRRLKAFNGQLAGCLQLLAGSLQAGLSLAQGLDTVVREGQEPLSSEFRRALVETRLGVPIEVALESIGDRMESADFKWTVMAIRIQREVGGNLSELLLNVAATLRERDYLRRQVKALSAEGRFSAYILLALPPCIIAYMMVSNPEYLHPLVSTPIGYVMLGAMVVLMLLGSLMMKKMIKVEV
jgi:tight adherence protein B